MLILAAFLATTAPITPSHPEVRVTTRVLVRILSGAGVRNGRTVGDLEQVRPTRGQARVVEPETGARILSLVEFP